MYSWRPNLGFCTAYSSIQPLRYATNPLGLGLKSPSFDFDLKNFLCVFPKLSFKYKISGVRLGEFGNSAGGAGYRSLIAPLQSIGKDAFLLSSCFSTCVTISESISMCPFLGYQVYIIDPCFSYCTSITESITVFINLES